MCQIRCPNFACFQLWNFWGMSDCWYNCIYSAIICIFLQHQQQQKILLTVFWKSQQPGSCCSVRDSIAILESTIAICLQRKQWPAECQQPYIVTAWSTPPLRDAPGLSCRRLGGGLLHTKQGSCQQEAKVGQGILPRKANKMYILPPFQRPSYGRFFSWMLHLND